MDLDGLIPVEIPDEERRQIVKKLYRLASLEALAERCIKDLYGLAQQIYEGLNKDLLGLGNGELIHVSNLERQRQTDTEALLFQWRVLFRDRPVLTFTCQFGNYPSPKPVIGRCEIREAGSKGPTISLHLTRENDGADWEVVQRDMGPPGRLTADGLLFLLDRYVSEALQRYQPR